MILVTGASSDIAQSIISRRLDKGDQVIATYSKDPSSMQIDLSSDLKTLRFGFAQYEQDFSHFSHEPIEALVLNAFERMPKLEKYDQWDFLEFNSYIQRNFTANAYLIQKLLKKSLAEKRSLKIILISSISTVMGNKGYSPYIIAKKSLESLVENLAVEYGQDGIQANILRLGVMRTSRTQFFWRRKSYLKKFEESVPSGRIGEPEDVPPVVDMLLDENCYINGQSINVSGGYPMVIQGSD